MRACAFWTLLGLSISVDGRNPYFTLEELKNGECTGLDTDLLDFLPSFGCLTTTTQTCQLMCHQGKETPGRNGALEEEEEGGSYVSLWSGNYKMAVFSAAVIEEQEADLPARGKWRQHEPKALDPSVDFFADLGMFSDFEKGHLFPYGYAKDADQGWATMTTANAVPQDRVFNQGVWSAVESHVKEYIKDCHHRDRQWGGYKAILVTGAVPDYFGEGEELRSETEFRVKKTTKNKLGNKPASRADPVPHFDPNINHGIDEELEDGLTVPTHMWTQFVCVQPRTMTVRSRVSLIGLNYRTGIVKRYSGRGSNGITATLETMYKNSLDGEYSSSDKMKRSEKKRGAKNFDMNHNKVCHQRQRLDYNRMRCTSDQTVTSNEDAKFWNDVNVKEIRRENENNRLRYLLAQF
jgi:hypothetical protein